MFASNYNNMSKTIEVYLWKEQTCRVDFVVNGETIHTTETDRLDWATTIVDKLATALDLSLIESRPSHIKYSNQCEKK